MNCVSDRINYKEIQDKHNWLFIKNQKCVISPDIDGILCGLFMSHLFDWEVVGYYDGKCLSIKNNIIPSECIFLDMEIYRKEYRSIGQHMLLYNKNRYPETWNNFSKCINPNNIRRYDANKNFQQKYPFATIHLLMCIIHNKAHFEISKDAITILLYVDGTFKNLLNYPENCISWLYFLNAKDANHPLAPLLNIFACQRISTIMHDLEKIFQIFREMADGKRGGDKIKISEIKNNSFPPNIKARYSKLISFLSDATKWKFKSDKWVMDDFRVVNFNKKILGGLNTKNYIEIIKHNPISFAITGTKQIEYTESHESFSQ